jgi:hypothetical protein
VRQIQGKRGTQHATQLGWLEALSLQITSGGFPECGAFDCRRGLMLLGIYTPPKKKQHINIQSRK